jgi:hypothetical protein
MWGTRQILLAATYDGIVAKGCHSVNNAYSPGYLPYPFYFSNSSLRKTKPTTCLKIGMSKPKASSPISPSKLNKTAKDSRKHFLISQSFDAVIW